MKSNLSFFSRRIVVGIAVLLFLLLLFHRLAIESDWPQTGQPPAHIGIDIDTTFAIVPASPAMASTSPIIMIDQTIRYGQTLAHLLEQSEVRPGDIVKAISALQSIFDPRDLRAGYSIRVAVDTAGALHQLLYRPSPEITVRVERAAGGDLMSRCDTSALAPEIFLLTGEVETTLYDAVLGSDERLELLYAFTDILQWDVDFFIDTQRGDRFRILFEKLFVQRPDGGKEFVRYGRILAASYEPTRLPYSSLKNDLIAFYFTSGNGKGNYYDRDGRSFQKAFLKSPLNYRRISSHFSSGRFHPILKKFRAHTGVDFAAATGTPVVASANGTIKEIGWKGGYGNCVLIEHKNHFATLYGHLSRFAEFKAGEAVAQGEVIGYVGSTGLSTGPHLHYTMYLNGDAIDPLKLQPTSGDPIPTRQFSPFAKQRDALLMQIGLLPDHLYGPPLWASRQ